MSSLFYVAFIVKRALLSSFSPDEKLLYSKRTNQNPSVLITVWLWSLGHHPPGHRREDPHALSDVRYSSRVRKPHRWGGMMGSQGLVMWSNMEASSTFTSVTAQRGLVQVIWGEKRSRSAGTLIKTSLPPWRRTFRCFWRTKHVNVPLLFLVWQLCGKRRNAHRRLTCSEQSYMLDKIRSGCAWINKNLFFWLLWQVLFRLGCLW